MSNTLVLNRQMVRSPSPSTERPRRSDAEATRASIIEAAESLFAERGIDAVSLVEVGVAAGQRNRSAVQYHFGDKEGLLRAIREKHAPAIERRRASMLDALEAKGQPSLRSLVEVLVLPVADKLAEGPAGEAYVRINAAMIGHPRHPLINLQTTRLQKTNARLMRLIAEASPSLPGPLLGPRMVLVTGLVFHGLVDQAALVRPSSGGQDWTRAVCHLVDCVVAVLRAPVSAETARARDALGAD
jgi:AcrR family transcriptional regulator